MDQKGRMSRFSVVKPTGRSQYFDPMTRVGAMLPPKQTAKTAMPADLCWTCPLCGPIEPLYIPYIDRWKKQPCSCQRQAKEKQKQQEQHQKWLEEYRTRTFGGWLGSRWVNQTIIDEMCSKTFATWNSTRFPDGLKKAMHFTDNPVGNLLFLGGYGTGKTYLEAAILNYLREVGRIVYSEDGKPKVDQETGQVVRKPTPSLFTSAPQFFMAYESAANASDKTRYISLLDQMISTEVLVIDDTDKARPTPARLDTYFLIFDERGKANKPTIISTNREANLIEYLGEGVAFSRLFAGLVTIKMEGSDYRLLKKR